jgi:hypothetical protein
MHQCVAIQVDVVERHALQAVPIHERPEVIGAQQLVSGVVWQLAIGHDLGLVVERVESIGARH